MNLFLARNKLRAYDLLLRYDFLSFLVITKLKQTQVDVLCTAVETRVANWPRSFVPPFCNGTKARGQFYARRPDGQHDICHSSALRGSRGCVPKRKLHGWAWEIFPKKSADAKGV